jgi:hypothetical protein
LLLKGLGFYSRLGAVLPLFSALPIRVLLGKWASDIYYSRKLTGDGSMKKGPLGERALREVCMWL